MKLRLPYRRIEPQERYGVVIGLIVLSYCLAAAYDNESWSNAVIFLQLLTVWLAFGISSSHRAQRTAGGILLLAGVAAVVAAFLGASQERDLDNLLFCLNAVLYMLAPVLIVRAIFRRPKVDVQTLLGAIAAYLMFGMMFAYVYRALGGVFTSPPFFGDQGPGTMSQALFFSFITLSTTGYGNLVPAANPGQTLAVLEAIVGQLFLVTAVAKIVSDYQGGQPRTLSRPRLLNRRRSGSAGGAATAGPADEPSLSVAAEPGSAVRAMPATHTTQAATEWLSEDGEDRPGLRRGRAADPETVEAARSPVDETIAAVVRQAVREALRDLGHTGDTGGDAAAGPRSPA